MNNTIKLIIALLLVIGGIAILKSNGMFNVKNETIPNDFLVQSNSKGYGEKIALESIFSEQILESDTPDNIAVIYTLNVQTCSPCINEISEFINIIDTSFVDNISFKQHALFSTESLANPNIENYLSITGLSINGSITKNRATYKTINIENSVNKFIPQISFVDLNSGEIFYQEFLSQKAMTPKSHKLQVLNEAYQIWNSTYNN
ncbi:hypothetical protein [Gracilimonas sp.]|uniref:hypothetical protein n=1 Tax=Gracilimonas sp. TaxID=1974203 RepID=UPI0028717B31|nr:hypothetical protein [Gracilimonas sp.]